MKKKLSIISLLTCVFILSCSSESYFKIGTSWVDTKLKIVYVDTCKARLSTVKIDSTATYNQGAILVGKYTDVNTAGEKLTGTIRAISYMEISSTSILTDIDNNAVFDSMVIEMRFNGFYMGDTLQDMHLSIHQLEERIKLDVVVGTETYYNTTSFKYNPEPLAEAVFPIHPGNTAYGISTIGGIIVDPVRVRLPNELGEDMFNKIINKEDEFDSNENFLDYFKGLVFVADDANTIAGFKTDTTFKMNLYYHIQEVFNTDKVLTFSINSMNQFNNIESNREGTKLLPDLFIDNAIESHLTDNQSYISAGDGLYTKIEFPNLQDILLTSTYGIVETAILEVKPVYGTYQEYTSLPSVLTISTSLVSGESESVLTDSNGQDQTGNLVIDQQFGENTLYSFDVTSFVRNQMTSAANQKLFLTLKLPSSEMQNSTQRLVIGDSDHPIDHNRIKLKLYYNMYNEKN
jgi:hypothetical protein